ncbi:hypothetical protein ACHAXR_004603 [Thalassiosira sp. AJA248-18]
MAHSSAARTNLTSACVRIHHDEVLGEGHFRTAYAGTYIGGNRNNQEAVCKCFKNQYHVLESYFFQSDFKCLDKAIQYAEDWNEICESDETILVTRGDVHTIGATKYLVEPLIRNFTKFTSNNGWISDSQGWQGEAMEAFTHYTYHRSGGNLIVCDLQGRYKYNRFNKSKSRFELTDVAVCSRRALYGPTDLGEKGIDSFFHGHVCNQFCNINGHWARPKRTRQWFPVSSSTSMMRSSQAHALSLNNRSTFSPAYDGILEEDSDGDY